MDRESGHKHRDRDRDSSKDHHHRDREHRHRHHRHSEKHGDERRRRQRSSDDDNKGSPSDSELRLERFSSRARDSVDREESVERHHRQHSSRKRKEHGDEEENYHEKSGKRPREEKRERRRFEDRPADDSGDLNGSYEERRDERDSSKKRKKEDGFRDREEDGEEMRAKEEVLSEVEEKKSRKQVRRFTDGVKVDEEKAFDKKERREGRRFQDSSTEANNTTDGGLLENGDQGNSDIDKSGSIANVVAQEPLSLASKVSVNSATSHHPLPNKVSSITTTNQNEGVSIRSDEVPGKSSTDGTTTSVTGRSGSLSLDALAKAKKALQMQKELSEKLKKIPVLNKVSSSTDKSQASSSKDGIKVPLSSAAQSGPSGSLSTASASLPQTAPVFPGIPSDGKSSASAMPVIPIEAVKRAQELAAQMGFRHDPDFGPLINMFPGQPTADMAVAQKPAKAPVLRLDAQGREIDEHGNIINMPKLTNLSTLKVNINKQKKEAFQIIKPDLDAIANSSSHFDERMGVNKAKLLRPKRMTFQFVEEGKWSKQAEIIKFKSQFGEAQAKELKMKQTQLAKAKAEPEVNPNLIAVGVRTFKEKKKEEIPEIEWWDKPILPTGSYSDIAEEKLNMEKITIYIEHPMPIDPPAEPAPPPPQPLKLTKKEQKKLRTQRRLAKERDRQEMIRQGLLEPPKPKIKMSNLMKVLGSEATQDPTKLEMEIRSAAAEREQAHVDRNIARKLTPAERREKKEKKLFDDLNSLETFVCVYKIKDLSHPQTRFKVDVNAQENRLTGCAVISDGVSVVVVEGGRKPIKRYSKLMLKRINWAAAVGDEEEGAEDIDSPPNSCVLVWQGTVAKPSFNRFLVHQCRSEAAARKLFADAGVPHYWDLSVNFSQEML